MDRWKHMYTILIDNFYETPIPPEHAWFNNWYVFIGLLMGIVVIRSLEEKHKLDTVILAIVRLAITIIMTITAISVGGLSMYREYMEGDYKMYTDTLKDLSAYIGRPVTEKDIKDIRNIHRRLEEFCTSYVSDTNGKFCEDNKNNIYTSKLVFDAIYLKETDNRDVKEAVSYIQTGHERGGIR